MARATSQTMTMNTKAPTAITSRLPSIEAITATTSAIKIRAKTETIQECLIMPSRVAQSSCGLRETARRTQWHPNGAAGMDAGYRPTSCCAGIQCTDPARFRQIRRGREDDRSEDRNRERSLISEAALLTRGTA